MNPMRGLIVAISLLAASGGQAEERPQTLYILNCAGCHHLDGVGDVEAHVPPLAYSGALMQDPEGRRYMVNVAGILASTLTASETASVLNWIKQRFAEPTAAASVPEFEAAEVQSLRGQRPADIVGLRRQIAARLQQRGIEIPGYPWP